MAKGDHGRGRAREETAIALGRRPTGAMGAAFALVVIGALVGLSLLLVGLMANARVAQPGTEAQPAVTAQEAEQTDGTLISVVGGVLMAGAVAGWVLLKRRTADKTLTLDDAGLTLSRGGQTSRAGWSEVVDVVWSTNDELTAGVRPGPHREDGPDDAWVVVIHLQGDRRLTIEGLDAWDPIQARATLRKALDRHASRG